MKTKSLNGFDFLAPVYDPMAWLVFGKDMRNAQTCFLDQIPSHAKVLILGGGTGWLLEELVKVRPQCEVWYIESSEKMIERASRLVHQNVHFILGTINEMPQIGFDVVVTHFFLDLFQGPTLQYNISIIRAASGPSVQWLVADFVDQGKRWQRAMLNVMYTFFGIVCGIEAKKLPDWHEAMMSQGMKKTLTNRFYWGFIESSVWRVVGRQSS